MLIKGNKNPIFIDNLIKIFVPSRKVKEYEGIGLTTIIISNVIISTQQFLHRKDTRLQGQDQAHGLTDRDRDIFQSKISS